MCGFDPLHCDCHESTPYILWEQPKGKGLQILVREWTAEYNAAIANGLYMKARRIGRKIDAVNVLLNRSK